MWCPGEGGGRGRCVTSEEVRLDRPASELADCGRPHASRGCGSVRTGRPLAGKGEVLGGQGLSLLIDLRVRACRASLVTISPREATHHSREHSAHSK